MANGVQTAAGSKIYIGTTNGNTMADTFTEIGEVTNIGEFGRMYQLITHSSLGNRNVQKFKGQRDDGDITLQLGQDMTDTGQAALDTALDSDFDYSFKIELNDESTTSGSHPTYYFFRAKVMSFRTNIGGPNDIVKASVQVAIKSGSITRITAT